MPIKVLHLLPPGFGGIDAYVFSHYKYMDRKKFHFDFLTQNKNLEGAAQYRNYIYKVYPLPTTAGTNREGFIQYVKEVLQNNYDIFHIHTSYWTGFVLEELAKDIGIKKVIVHSHSSFIDESDEMRREQLLCQHEDIKYKFFSELATDFWTCSWKAADWLFGPQIPREKIRIMKNAIELERYRFNLQTRVNIRRTLDAEASIVLGTVGRFSYQKNHAFLIKVFQEFHLRHNNSKLIIIGDGELRNNLETQIKETGLESSVILLGWKNNVEDYLSAMDCFLLPSRFEGFPISILEAAVSGLNCIISDCISDEIVFNNRIRRIPLKYAEWISTLEELMDTCFDRNEGVNIVRRAGYDVRDQAKVLEAMYEM